MVEHYLILYRSVTTGFPVFLVNTHNKCGRGKADIMDNLKDWTGLLAKTEHSHPLGMVVSTHFRCGKGVKRGLKNGALPFNID